MQGDKNAFTPDTYYAPGGIICVVVAGKPVHCLPFGYSSANSIKDLVEKPAHRYDPAQGPPIKESSLFRLGSTSKLFVGLALVMCKDRGLVQYDDPISKYLSEFVDTEVGRLTLRQLFTHSGGLPSLHKPGLRERDDEVVKATMTEIISSTLKITPDTSKLNQFSYSNVGVVLLAEIISRVQSRPYEAFVENEILAPLGMKHTYFHTSQIDRSLKTTGYFPNFSLATDPDLQAYAPVGGMYSTGPDMAKLMSLFQKALNGKEPLPSPFKPEIIRDLTSVYLREGPRAMGVSMDIGYSEAQTMIGHNGRIDGYASYFTWAKESEVGVVFLANGGFPLGRTSAPELMKRLLRVKKTD
jgi:CubicO group peptidase (beta-lactamase class C family)